MFRYRLRGRRNFTRRVARISRRANSIILAKRILVHDFLIPDVSAADFDNPSTFDLIGARENIDEEIESTGGTTLGTDVATCPVYSRLVKMRLNMVFRAANATFVRWMLVKSPDSDITAATFNTNFHSSDDTTGIREVRKHILAKGFVNIPSDRLAAPFRVRVSRAAWARASPMRENDVIRLVFAKEAAGTTATLSGFGTIWVRANA